MKSPYQLPAIGNGLLSKGAAGAVVPWALKRCSARRQPSAVRRHSDAEVDYPQVAPLDGCVDHLVRSR